MRDWRKARVKKKPKSQIGLTNRRLVYECANLQSANGRCSCTHGKRLSLAKDSSVSDRLILCGIIPAACRSCELYREEIIRCA